MKIYKFLILSFLIASCSAQKRLDRLIYKNPHLKNSDTTEYFDTIRLYTSEFRLDTFTTINSMRKDTFIVTRENMIFKSYFRHDTIVQIIEKQRESLDTLVRTQIITNTVTANPIYKVKNFIWWGVALIILILLIRIIWPLIKRFIPFIK